jgi:beta-lactamase class A
LTAPHKTGPALREKFDIVQCRYMAIFGGRDREKEKDKDKGKEERLRGKSGEKLAFKKTTKRSPSKPRQKGRQVWGKKERYLIFYVLLGTALISAILSFSARNWKLPGFPRIKFPSLPLLEEETIVIEKEGDGESDRSEKAIAAFEEKADKLSGIYGLYVIRLGNGSNYGVSEKESFQAASLIKLPVMAAMYIEAEKGSIDLESRYKLKASDKVGGAGSLETKPEGYEISYRDLIKLMGRDSDNTAFNIAVKILEKEKVEDIIEAIGMINTSLEGNSTTPYDIGLFFEELWKNEIVSEKYRDELLDYLTDTSFEEWLPAGVPSGIRVAHKYGRELHVVNDAGIVFANEPFILVIMSKGVVEKEADKVIPELARVIYETETEGKI